MMSLTTSNRIAVLGRGKSLTRYPHFAHLFDKLVLVNPFSREIETLGTDHFKGKELIHVVSKGSDCRLSPSHYKLFSKVTTTANGPLPLFPWRSKYPGFKLFSMLERGLPTSLSWEEIDWMLLRREPLPATEKRKWPTTGVFAIDLILHCYHPMEIYLFGFDFYGNGFDSYFVEIRKSYQTPESASVMKLYMEYLVGEFPEIQFRTADPSVLDITGCQGPPYPSGLPNWHGLSYRDG